MGVIEYSSNNSGGHWWLTDENWQALEDAGWVVHWVHDREDPSHTHEPSEFGDFGGHHHHGYDSDHRLTRVTPTGDRWLGTLATAAAKETDDPGEAVREWESVTGQNASDEGCNCCGSPHSFTYIDDLGETHFTSVHVTSTELRWD